MSHLQSFHSKSINSEKKSCCPIGQKSISKCNSCHDDDDKDIQYDKPKLCFLINSANAKWLYQLMAKLKNRIVKLVGIMANISPTTLAQF
jgi:cytochrome c553